MGKCWRYIDVIRDRRGRLRSWEGHLRALARAEGISLRMLLDGMKGESYAETKNEQAAYAKDA